MDDYTYRIKGVLNNASFRNGLDQLIKDVSDQFEGLEKLELEVVEVSLHEIENSKSNYQFKLEKSLLHVYQPYHKYYDNQGNATRDPSERDVRVKIRSLLTTASEEFRNT